MTKFVDNYKLGQKIGQGEYGDVYLCTHKDTNEKFAIKAVSQQKINSSAQLQQFIKNEIHALKKLDNVNIVAFEEILRSSNNTYYVYEYCNGGDLEKYLKKKGRLSEKNAIKILIDLLNAFRDLRKYNIIHRDIKPQNVMLHNGTVKLGDFGFCKELKNGQKAKIRVGSPVYMAPEILFGQRYDEKCDIYSLGCLLYELLFAQCPFEAQNIQQLKSQIQRGYLQFPRRINISQQTEKLIRRMLANSPSQRITWNELLNYNFSYIINYSPLVKLKAKRKYQLLSHRSTSSQNSTQSALSRNSDLGNLFVDISNNVTQTRSQDFAEKKKLMVIKQKVKQMSKILKDALELNISKYTLLLAFVLNKKIRLIIKNALKKEYTSYACTQIQTYFKTVQSSQNKNNKKYSYKNAIENQLSTFTDVVFRRQIGFEIEKYNQTSKTLLKKVLDLYTAEANSQKSFYPFNVNKSKTMIHIEDVKNLLYIDTKENSFTKAKKITSFNNVKTFTNQNFLQPRCVNVSVKRYSNYYTQQQMQSFN